MKNERHLPGWPLRRKGTAFRLPFALLCLFWVASPVCVAAEPAPVTTQLALDAGGHTGWVRRVLVDPYRNQLISVSHDKTIRFWSMDTYEPLRVLRPPIGRGSEGELYSAALSPDCSLLAVSGFMAPAVRGDHRVLLISLPEGEIVARLAGSTAPIYGLAFSPDGRWLAAGGEDAAVRVWEVGTRKLSYTWTGHAKRVTEVAWNPQGTQLASVSWDHTARLWSLGQGQIAVRSHPGGLVALAWSHDGKWLATGGSGATIRLWDQAGRVVMSVAAPRDVQGLAFSADDRRLAYGWGSRYHPGQGAGLLSVPDGRVVANFAGHLDTPVDAVFTHNDQRVVFSDAHGDLCAWDTKTASLMHRMRSAGSELYANGWSPDGRAIGFGYHKTPGSTLKGTSPLEQSFCLEMLDFGPPPDKSFRRAQSQRGDMAIERIKYRYLRGKRNDVRVWKYEIPAKDANIRSRTLLAGNRAAVGYDSGLIVLNTTNGQAIYQLPGHTDAVWAVSPSPDDRYLLTASCDQTLEIWNLANYELVLTLFFAGDQWIAWTPRGYYAASLAGEGLMGWHVQSGPDKMAEFYPASLFHKAWYRPDVIRRILPLGSPLAALREADRQQQTSSEPVIIEAHLPPVVTLEIVTDTQGSASTGTGSNGAGSGTAQTFRARALPGGRDAVKSLQLLIDGRPATAQPAATPADPSLPTGGLTTEWTLALPAGEHSLVAKADTERSFQLSEPLRINKGQSATRLPRLFVLAMGVTAYDHPGLATPSAAADAQALADTLKKLGQAEFREVLAHVLTDQQVTRSSLDSGLAWMKQYAADDDVGIVYFAGRAAADSHNELMLLPHESPVGQNAQGLSAAAVERSLQSTRGKLLFLLDASEAANRQSAVSHDYCSGDFQSGSGAASATSAVDQLLRSLSSDNAGVSVMGRLATTTASAQADSPTTVSSPAAVRPHGALMQALLDGLGGAADGNHDGRVELAELERFVRGRLDHAAAGAERVQISRPSQVPSYPLTRP